VTFNDDTKETSFYTTTSGFVTCLGTFSQERQILWFPKDDLKDPSTWSSPPLVLHHDIHDGLLAKYDCKDTMPSQSHPGARTRVGYSQQDGDAQQKETDPLRLPELTRLHETYHVWGEEDSPNVVVIPAQHRVTEQILSMSQPFKDLKQTFAVSRRPEQLCQLV
jgi:hypothetical protein